MVPSSGASTSSVEEVVRARPAAAAASSTATGASARKRRIVEEDEEDDLDEVQEVPQPMQTSDEEWAPEPTASSSPPVSRARLRSGGVAAATSVRVSASPPVASIFSKTAAAAAPTTRKRLRRAIVSSDEDEQSDRGERKSRDDDDEEEEEEEKSHASSRVSSPAPNSPRTRRAAAGGRQGKLAPSERSALQQLAADRARLAEGKSTTRASKRQRSRLDADASDEEAEAGPASKYARAEQIIHADDTSDDEAVVAQLNSKYFDHARGSYNPDKEARELRRIEQAEEDKRAAAAADQERRKDDAYVKYKAKEAAKRAQRSGKGIGTTKATKQRAPRKKKENLDEYDDEDGFVVGSDEDFEDESDAEGFTHQAFDERRFEQEELHASLAMMEASMAPKEAFTVWARYLCGAIVDDGYSGVVDRNARLRARFNAAQKIVEEQFQLRLSTWVRSQTWSRKDAADVAHHMDSLGYSHSTPQVEDKGCEICLPKKGHSHQATHSLSYFGVPYSPAGLKHPFLAKNIILSPAYEQHSFSTGQLCHQRLKLYHVMRHFKLHVMLFLKSRMKKACVDLFHSEKPSSREACFKVMYYMFDRDAASVMRQYAIWEQLNSAALSYSTADSRKAFVDLDTLGQMQDFDREECLLDLFNWREIGRKDRFDASKFVLAQEDNRAAGFDNMVPAKRKATEDEYEIDEDAEREADEAEKKAHEVEKKAQAGIFVDDASEIDVDDLVVLPPRNGSSAGTSSISKPTQSLSSSTGGWRTRKGSGLGSSMPPSSAESIQDHSSDNESVTEMHGTAAATGSSAPVASSSGTWRSRKGATLPLSLAGSTSPPKANYSPSRSPPTSAAKPIPKRVADGEELHALYAILSEEERVSFLACVAAQAQPAEVRAFNRSIPAEQRAIVKEWLQEVEEQM